MVKPCKTCGADIVGRHYTARTCAECRNRRLRRKPVPPCRVCGGQIVKREPQAKICWDCVRGEWRAAAKRAVETVQRAKRSGRLPRIKEGDRCVDCGNQAQQYEHRDYTRPLDVEMVCRSCNHKRGSGKYDPELRALQLEKLTDGELVAE